MAERKSPRQQVITALRQQVELGADELVLSGTSSGRTRKARMQKPGSTSPTIAAEPIQPALAITIAPTYESLDAHNAAICSCQLCPLGQTRNQFVYGVGNPNARLMFIGEAPGADEDRLGEPFVGRAGQLLDRILAAMQLSRQEVYIANILKCRPPGNRDPLPAEVATCTPYLKEQIRLIKPQLLCALGRIAAQFLLNTTTPLGKLRGHWHEYEGTPMLVTYHPAALLRFPEYKKETWADMQFFKARYDQMSGTAS